MLNFINELTVHFFFFHMDSMFSHCSFDRLQKNEGNVSGYSNVIKILENITSSIWLRPIYISHENTKILLTVLYKCNDTEQCTVLEMEDFTRGWIDYVFILGLSSK